MNYLNNDKRSQGVSKTKLKDYQDEVPMGCKVNVEAPLFLGTPSAHENGWLRRKRNEVVHEGAPVPDDEAIKSQKAP